MPRLEPFPYRIEVLYSEADGCYVARVPSIKGCAAHGDSPEAAAAEARKAATAVIDVLHGRGDPIPRSDLAKRTAS